MSVSAITPILATGNPFVDTGLYAVRARASEIDDGADNELTPQLMERVLADGKWLAQKNRQLNSFFMVSGTNSLLVNPSSNKWMYKTGERGYLDERDEGWQAYLQTLMRLRDDALNPPPDAPLDCESCGERPATRVLERVGRDYFPLAGSLGNDAQALPAASRSPHICSLCLLAIQWLPLGAIMFNGNLACFQFTDSLLSYQFVKDTYHETISRLESAKLKDKVTVPGSKEGATPAAQFLIERMRKLQHDKVMLNLPPYITLNIWQFTNSGANPDCRVTEIHNPALQFLWEAARTHYNEIKELLRREDSKKPGTHLLTAIESQRDYAGFYPQKKARAGAEVASKSLYELYQIHVLGRPLVALRVAERLAVLVYKKLSEGSKDEKKLLAALLKENPRWSKDPTIRTLLRRQVTEAVGEGYFTLEEYVRLFPAANLNELAAPTPEAAQQFWREPGRAVRGTTDGWDVFWFYLHHAEGDAKNESGESEQATTALELDGDLAMFTNPKIQTFARDLFDYYLERQGGEDKARGLRYINRYILEKFKRGKITNGDLRRWFCLLAETQPDYRCEDWDALCRDEQGRDAIGELRFQFRLEMANLYREAQQTSAPAEATARS